MVSKIPKVGIGIQSRISSRRFPNKIFHELWDNRTVLDQCIRQCLRIKSLLNGFEVEISLLVPESQKIVFEPIAQAFNLKIIGGSEDYVFKRYSAFYKDGNYDYIVRITSDCPVLQPFLAEQLIREAVDNNLDYAQIQTPNDFPDGFDVEVFKSSLLPRLEQIAKEDSMTREHVTWALKFDTRFDKISKWNLPKDSKYNLPKISIDTVEDLKRIQGLKGDLWWLD